MTLKRGMSSVQTWDEQRSDAGRAAFKHRTDRSRMCAKLMPPSFVRIIPHRRVVGSWRCAVGNKTSQIHPFSIHNTFKTAHILALPLLDFPHQLFAQHTASRRSGSDIIGEIAFHVLKKEQAAFFSVEKDMLFEQTDNLLLMVDKKPSQTGTLPRQLHIQA